MIYQKSLSYAVLAVIGLCNRPPELTISEWADRERRLSPESSAEPGQWHTDRAPYMKEIMDTVNDPVIETVVMMTSSQVGKTELILNIIGYHIHQDPAPILSVQPTIEMAETFSKDRLAPMIRDTPALTGKVKDARSRDSGNTLRHKTFPGGMIALAGANSPASLASRPIRIVLLDEVDRFPPSAGAEGDPVNLAIKRSTTFWNRKIILTSTPTIKNASRIEAAFNESDMQRYYVPCPHCEEFQHLKWANVKWDENQPETAAYACEHCGAMIEEFFKAVMIRKGEWRPTSESNNPRTAGFHLNEIYSPWKSWAEMAQDFLEAKKLPETLQTWINTALGESWEEEGEGVEDTDLKNRTEPLPKKKVSQEVLVITAGVDVQDNRLECEVVGWGQDKESWSLDYHKLPGDPERQDVWDQLDAVLSQTYERPIHDDKTHPLKIACACVDSGAHTQAVYNFAAPRQRKIGGVCATKGYSQPAKPLVSRPRKTSVNKAVKLYMVGTDTAKDMVYGRLKIKEPGPGYCHFPDDYEDEYFEQLTSEEVVTSYKKGVATRVWRKKRSRNEALDCRVLNLVALAILNPKYGKIAKNFEKIEANAQAEETPETEAEQDTKILKKTRKRQSRRKGGYVHGYKR